MVARSGAGLARRPPAPGDEPQVWVVDSTRPDVRVLEVAPATVNRSHSVVIRWAATGDDRLAAAFPSRLPPQSQPLHHGPALLAAAAAAAAAAERHGPTDGSPAAGRGAAA